MKLTSIISTFCLLAFCISCSKENEQLAENRDAGFNTNPTIKCDCSGILYQVENLSIGSTSSGCCAVSVTFRIQDINCAKFYTIKFRDKVLPLTNVATNYIFEDICNSNTEAITILSRKTVCDEIVLKCGECCEAVSVDQTDLGANESGCCQYSVTVGNPNSCNLKIFDSDGRPLYVVPSSTYNSYPFSICQDNVLDELHYVVGETFDKPCQKFTIGKECRSNGLPQDCTNVQIFDECLRKDGDCCFYNVIAYNGGQGTVQLMTNDGVILSTMNPGDFFSEEVRICKPTRFIINTLDGKICRESDERDCTLCQ